MNHPPPVRKAFGLLGVFLSSLAITSASPIPVAPPVAGPGDGINVRFVEYTPSIAHNIAEAVAALSLAPGDPNYVAEFNGVTDRIDFADGDYGEVTPAHNAPPFPEPALFAVRFSGYLNVLESGDHTFQSFTDDGFRLTLGGEVISAFDADRGPGYSVTPPISLTPGLYEIEMIGWEQGGAFVNELSWMRPSDSFFGVPDATVLFTHIPSPGVPDSASTCALLMLAMVGMTAFSRKCVL